jgi:putative CocE/NonD family hydrolase
MTDQPQKKKPYEMHVEKNVYVPMRDGVPLAVDIYRPDASGKFPGLLAISTYGKETQCLSIPSVPDRGTAPWDGNIEAGDSPYIVSRGYVHIVADCRGTGYSGGESLGVSGRGSGWAEDAPPDEYDLIEWIAQQPWCDGNVGMFGISQFGAAQTRAAIQQPPHLRAIAPIEFHLDLYRDLCYHGGVHCGFGHELYQGGGQFTSGWAPRNVVSEMMTKRPKEEFDRLLEKALNDRDIQHYTVLYHLLKYPYKNPSHFDVTLNPLDGPFYWEKSAGTKLDRIKIPVYAGNLWGHTSYTRGALDLYRRIDLPKKLIMMPHDILDRRPWRSFHDTLLRWYDHWLKGVDTGMMDEPPLKLWVSGIDQWREGYEWPLPTTQWTRFYLRSWEGLSLEPELHSDEPDCYLQQPLFVSFKRDSVKYLTPPLPENLTVIGPLSLHMHAAIDQDDTNWQVVLSDVGEQGGRARPLTQGWLKASHRRLDEEKSKPGEPYHPHTEQEFVVPGEIYEYAIGLAPMAHVFKAGHRIQVEILSMDSIRDPGQHHGVFHLPISRTTLHKVYHDSKHRSHLLLPMIL